MAEQAWPLQDHTVLLDDQAAAATKYFNEKKYAEAEALALKILDLAPNQRMALRVLYEVRKAQNQVPAALALARRLAALPGGAPQRAAAHAQLAHYLVGLGRHAEALPAAAAALKATPRDATAQHVMGVVLTETGDFLAGERHYRQALARLGREDGLVLANLAWNLKQQGRLAEAKTLYDQALALRGDNPRGIGGAAQVAFARGERARAEALLDDALRRWPEDRPLRLLRALADLAQDRAQAVLDRLSPVERLIAPEFLARGQAQDRLGQLREAVTSFATARRIQRERAGLTYQPAPLTARAAAYQSYFTADRVQPLPRAAAGPFTPVFLLGFARAGTGLLEQLLAQVPGFAVGDAAGSFEGLADAVPRLAASEHPYPEALDDLLVGDNQQLPEQLRQMYEEQRARLGLLRPYIRFITDRAVGNAWHLGLINLLYPEAPIIHVLRHPYDLMLANIAQDRKLEGNAHAGLPALAHYYGLHAEMIRHYRGQLTLRYLPVRYEDLVADPAAVLAEILAFIGGTAPVPAAEILRANAGPLPEPQPAHFIFREPVHTRAAGRYRAYLAAMPQLFAEVQAELAPWIERLGYTVEEARA